MKTLEVVKLLTKAGWHLVRHGKKHDLYGHDDHPGVLIAVPRHPSQEIPKGTLRKIMKEAGI